MNATPSTPPPAPVLPFLGRRRAALRGELAPTKPLPLLPVQRRLMLATTADFAVEMVGGDDDLRRAERAARSLLVHRGSELSGAERLYLAESIAFWSKLTARVITVSPLAASIAPVREAA